MTLTSDQFPTFRTTIRRIEGRGFTVVEVIMVLALLAAIITLVLVNFPRLEGAFGKRAEVDTARLAILEAHLSARETQNRVSLVYDSSAKSFLVNDASGVLLASRTMPADAEVTVTLRRLKPEARIAEEPTWETEDAELNAILFSPTGPSTPFSMEIETQTGLHRLVFDPFTHDVWHAVLE